MGSSGPSGRVLVTEASERAALAIIRNLGGSGLRVTAAEDVPVATGFFSRYCDRRLVYPSPVARPDEWLACILSELKRQQYDMIVPIDDLTVLLCARHRQEIEQHTHFPFAGYDTLMLARDKGATVRLAQRNGIPCPQTVFVSSLDELPEAARQAPYPCIVKPRESSGARGIEYVSSPEQLLDTYPEVHQGYPFPLIQEYIPTEEGQYDVAVLVDGNGDPCAIHQFQQLREYPLSGGPATLRVSIWDKEAEQLALSLLKAMGWYGVALVEMKRDSRDGSLKLLEVNPRFWSSLHLATVSGVPFPMLLYELAVTGAVRKPVLRHETGRMCRSLLPGDMLHFLARLRRGRFDRDFFRPSYWVVDDDVLALSDLGPGVGFWLMTLQYLLMPSKWKHVFGRAAREPQRASLGTTEAPDGPERAWGR